MSTLAQRLEKYSIPEPNSGCILWFGYTSEGGYGRIKNDDGKLRSASRLAYELEKGPIPEGLELDHLCRVRCCINPNHLEPVTHTVNVNRGLLPKQVADRNRANKPTHCKRGHPRTPENVCASTRQCRLCLQERARNLSGA